MFNEAANFDVTTCRVGLLAWNHVENDIFMSIGLRPILSSTVPCQEKLDCKYHEKANWILPRHFSPLLTKTNHKQEDMTVFIVLMEHTQRRKKGGKTISPASMKNDFETTWFGLQNFIKNFVAFLGFGISPHVRSLLNALPLSVSSWKVV